jgi:hypothetical protein
MTKTSFALTSGLLLSVVAVAATTAVMAQSRSQQSRTMPVTSLLDTVEGAMECSTGPYFVGPLTPAEVAARGGPIKGTLIKVGSGRSPSGSERRQPTIDDASFIAACDAAQVAIMRVNADAAALERFAAALDACDVDAARLTLADAGFTDAIVPNAQFHAIQTKGTGSQRRASEAIVCGGPTVAAESTAAAAARGASDRVRDPVAATPSPASETMVIVSYSRPPFRGHVTIMR